MCWLPPATAVAFTPSGSCTATGVELSTVVPLPSCPSPLFPQHSTAPEVITAHVWSQPEPIALTPLPRPLTVTGMLLHGVGCSLLHSCGPVLVPSPSCPAVL